jgi:hypothetical protein
MARPKNETKRVVMLLRLMPKTVAEIKRMAKCHGLTYSQVVDQKVDPGAGLINR